MITTYLRLDLYKKNGKDKPLKYVDSCDLTLGEDVYDLLEGYSDFHYAELVFCSGPSWVPQKEIPEYFFAAFRRISLKGKENYEWIVCERIMI